MADGVVLPSTAKRKFDVANQWIKTFTSVLITCMVSKPKKHSVGP